jgi:hypothetical protein
MRIVELSDYPAERLRQTRRRGTAQAGREQRQFADDLARHDEAVSAARRVAGTARAQRRWGAWLRAILAVRRARRRAPVPPAAARLVSDEEAQQAAGVQGERLAVSGLGRILSDEWILLRGYRNQRGEIDAILAGPGGLAAIEVKYHNATVTCDGDIWWFTKYDRYGNRVGPAKPMADAGGRSPSVQLAEPARLLEDFLRRRGHQVAPELVVLLNHPRARLASCIRPTVHLALSAGDVTAALRSASVSIPPAEVEQLAELISRDHKYHQQRRRS